MTPVTKRLKRDVLIAVFLGHLLAAVLLGLAGSPLLLYGETPAARLIGGGTTMISLGFLSLWLLRFRKTRRIGATAAPTVLAIGFCCYVGAFAAAPSGKVPDGNFTQVYSGDCAFRRNAVANVVPEIDQLKLGTYLFPRIDYFIDRDKGRRIQELFLNLYREMRQDKAFVEAGSVLGMCYEDLFLGVRRKLHFYQYVPRQVEQEPYPVVLFLHGSLGNFKGYVWVLKSMADATGYAVIAPTYGAGNWRLDSDCSIVKKVYEYCKHDPMLDENAIYLAGISNGGTGMTRAIRDHGDRYRGFIFISPVIEHEVILSDDFARHAARKRCLIIHGEEDLRIPATHVQYGESVFKEKGMTVESHYYPDEDHFLLFSQRDAVMRDIRNWLPVREPCQ